MSEDDSRCSLVISSRPGRVKIEIRTPDGMACFEGSPNEMAGHCWAILDTARRACRKACQPFPSWMENALEALKPASGS